MNDYWLETPSGRKRARALGFPFEGTPGTYNAITDVSGVEVGYCTIVQGAGKRVVGKGPIRTGVTAILPRARAHAGVPVFAAAFRMNGNGELTGTHWIDEVGRFDSPIALTNTHALGRVHSALIRWMVRTTGMAGQWALPVVGETYDGYLNDINGFHVTEEHALAALDAASAGAVDEGSVGGGTGMICYGFKGGSGTASREVSFAAETFTIGAFVQANFGHLSQLTIGGVPVGKLLERRSGATGEEESGSVIAVLATDAPLLPHQLGRLVRRVALGIGRSGSIAGHGSGDIFLAFSTANAHAHASSEALAQARFLPDDRMNPMFDAVIHCVDEAVLNAMVANETMTGADDHTIEALPHEDVREILNAYGRLEDVTD